MHALAPRPRRLSYSMALSLAGHALAAVLLAGHIPMPDLAALPEVLEVRLSLPTRSAAPAPPAPVRKTATSGAGPAEPERPIQAEPAAPPWPPKGSMRAGAFPGHPRRLRRPRRRPHRARRCSRGPSRPRPYRPRPPPKRPRRRPPPRPTPPPTTAPPICTTPAPTTPTSPAAAAWRVRSCWRPRCWPAARPARSASSRAAATPCSTKRPLALCAAGASNRPDAPAWPWSPGWRYPSPSGCATETRLRQFVAFPGSIPMAKMEAVSITSPL